MVNYYSLLGVPGEASPAAVRKAFLEKALVAHPDRGGSEAALQDVMRAFETLSDPHLRDEYDRRTAGSPNIAVAVARMREGEAFQEQPVALAAYVGYTKRCYQQRLAAEDDSGESQVFARLYKLLRSLPRDQRQAMLAQRFSEPQRRSFERWILAQKLHNHQDVACEVPTSKQRRRHDSDVAPRKARCRSVIGVSRQGSRYRYYFASVIMEGLQLLSKTSSDLEMVLGYHSALVLIKQRVARGDSSFAANFRHSLWQTLNECGLDATAMGLRLRVSLRVLWVSSALRTVTYLVPSQLEEGLEAHRRLTNARGRVDRHRSNVLRRATPQDIGVVWTDLRREFLAVMSAAGRPLTAVSLRLEALEVEQHACQEKQSERWNRAQMAKEDRISRQQMKLQGCQSSNQSSPSLQLRQNRKTEYILRAEKAIQKLLVRSLVGKRPLRRHENGRWSHPRSHRTACCSSRFQKHDDQDSYAGAFATSFHDPHVDLPRRRRLRLA